MSFVLNVFFIFIFGWLVGRFVVKFSSVFCKVELDEGFWFWERIKSECKYKVDVELVFVWVGF